MKIEFNKVTWYSKLAAIILFILVLPIWTFYLGTQYENVKDISYQNQMIQSQAAENLTDEQNADPTCPEDHQDRQIQSSNQNYKNTALGYQLDIPKGWYISKDDNDNPYFYVCQSDGLKKDAFEITDASEDMLVLSDSDKKHLLKDVSLDVPIKDAQVFQESRPSDLEGFVGEGYPGLDNVYIILFPNLHKSFYFMSQNEINHYDLSTFKPIP